MGSSMVVFVHSQGPGFDPQHSRNQNHTIELERRRERGKEAEKGIERVFEQ